MVFTPWVRYSFLHCTGAASSLFILRKGKWFRQKPTALCQGTSNMQVRMVVVLHRHGARTPAEQGIFPGVPNPGTPEYAALWGLCPEEPKPVQGQQSFWPSRPNQPADGVGVLTQTGSEQLWSLGSYLRARYGNEFIFRENSFAVRSTTSSRAILSAASLLQGLCPGMARDEALSWVTCPYRYSKQPDSMYGASLVWFSASGGKKCPRLQQLFNKAWKESQAWPAVSSAKEVYSTVVQRSGMEVKDPGHAFLSLGDLLNCYAAPGYTLPYGVTDEEHEALDLGLYDGIVGLVEALSEEGALLGGGRLVADVQALLENVLSKGNVDISPAKEHLSMNILSGHDVSLVAFLSALGMRPSKGPGFGACVLVELLHHTSSRGWQVRIMYLEDASSSKSMQFKELLCLPLEQWRRLIAPAVNVAGDWQERCKAHDPAPGNHA